VNSRAGGGQKEKVIQTDQTYWKGRTGISTVADETRPKVFVNKWRKRATEVVQEKGKKVSIVSGQTKKGRWKRR